MVFQKHDLTIAELDQEVTRLNSLLYEIEDHVLADSPEEAVLYIKKLLGTGKDIYNAQRNDRKVT